MDEKTADKSAGVLAVVAGLGRIRRDSESEPTGAIHHLGVHYDCPHGGRGQQSEVMTWKQAKAEALRLVEQAALNRSELHLTEYQSQDRYLADHPTGRAHFFHSNVTV